MFLFSLRTHCNKPGLEYSQEAKTTELKYNNMRSHPALDFDGLFGSAFLQFARIWALANELYFAVK